ncbi:ABC transporter ATP-binding protein [Brackiella oedipodis]|uniref:iron ABC transporter ATP-binding protein n=1 Tax=Brackiella oedipodis TaxID=124225 RepID=UPI000491945F|nr:ATP-binding cassette domain-containing protein [Brackiella oedipodis]
MFDIQNISKKYNEKYVLKNCSVSFLPQTITSLIGPNGAGKSTLLMMMAKLLTPTSGSIFLSNQDISNIVSAEYAKKVATQRQHLDNHFRLTVKELVEFGRFPHGRGYLSDSDHRIVAESIEFLGLKQIANEQINELSGGQKQMAYLAMALAQDTPCLLLDEPLNNLDIKHSVELMQALNHLKLYKHKTIVLVIHDINFASNFSDYIVALKEGELYCQGTPQEVINANNLRDLYGINFEIIQQERAIFCNYFQTKGGRDVV